MTKLLPQAEPVDCEACFLKTLHTSGQWTLWKSFVEFRCRIRVNFTILITSRENFPPAERYGSAQADQRWLQAPAGFSGLRTKGFSRDAWTSGSRHQKRDSGFEQIRAGGRLAGTYAEPTGAGAAEAAGAADSGGELRRGIHPARALLISVVR